MARNEIDVEDDDVAGCQRLDVVRVVLVLVAAAQEGVAGCGVVGAPASEGVFDGTGFVCNQGILVGRRRLWCLEPVSPLSRALVRFAPHSACCCGPVCVE